MGYYGLQIGYRFVSIHTFPDISGLVSHHHIHTDFVLPVQGGAERVAAIMGIMDDAEILERFLPRLAERVGNLLRVVVVGITEQVFVFRQMCFDYWAKLLMDRYDPVLSGSGLHAAFQNALVEIDILAPEQEHLGDPHPGVEHHERLINVRFALMRPERLDLFFSEDRPLDLRLGLPDREVHGPHLVDDLHVVGKLVHRDEQVLDTGLGGVALIAVVNDPLEVDLTQVGVLDVVQALAFLVRCFMLRLQRLAHAGEPLFLEQLIDFFEGGFCKLQIVRICVVFGQRKQSVCLCRIITDDLIDRVGPVIVPDRLSGNERISSVAAEFENRAITAGVFHNVSFLLEF